MELDNPVIFCNFTGDNRCIMADKQLLLGDEALALGALHAGLTGVYA